MLAAALPERVLGPSFGPAMKPSSDTERSMIVGVRVRGCVKLGGPFSRGPRAVRPLCISVTVELLLGGGWSQVLTSDGRASPRDWVFWMGLLGWVFLVSLLPCVYFLGTRWACRRSRKDISSAASSAARASIFCRRASLSSAILSCRVFITSCP